LHLFKTEYTGNFETVALRQNQLIISVVIPLYVHFV
jgi:hypothetical protein